MEYQPESFAGGTQEQMVAWLLQELNKVRQVLNGKQDAEVRFRASPPERVREGLIAAADGVNWNPGAGKGLYLYTAGTWQKL